MLKSGAGAESTLDTGLLADGTWRIFWAERWRSGAWAAYSVDMSDPDVGPRLTLLGTLNANHPTVGTQPMPLQALNITGGAGRAADIDFFGWGCSGMAR